MNFKDHTCKSCAGTVSAFERGLSGQGPSIEVLKGMEALFFSGSIC